MKRSRDKFLRAARANAKALVAVGLMAGLSACATAADSSMMAVTTAPASAPFPARLLHAMCVRNVTGGEATNPLWVSKVSDDQFRLALVSTLDSAGLDAPADGCQYQIDANLLGMSQPFAGFDMTVTSHVNYKVFGKDGTPVLLATVDAPYTAKFSDSLMAVERLKLANEGSMRDNIGQFLDKLRGPDLK